MNTILRPPFQRVLSIVAPIRLHVASLSLLLLVTWGLNLLAQSAATSSSIQITFLNQQISMRDGIRLSTDIYIPPGNRQFPVIIARTPYTKHGSANLGTNGVERGFAVVIQDVRGRHASEGENLPFDQDITDGFDTLKWVSAQPWCNGKIGTWGGSAGAITQIQLVASESPLVTCQHLVVGAPNLYTDVVYTGGVFRKALVEDWLRISQFGPQALPRWIEHPTYDDYWIARDTSRHYPKINAPAIHVGGYWDIFAQGTIDCFRGYQEKGGPKARGHQRLIMGPWTHGVLQEKAGELSFPGAKRPPGNPHDSWSWFDLWLRDQPKEKSNGLPIVTYYVVGDVTDKNAPGNEWRTAQSWPPLPTLPTRFFLRADKSLTMSTTDQEAVVSWTYDPNNPAPTIGGIQLTLPAGPMDQRALDTRSDVMVFTTQPLTTPVEVIGRVAAHLWVSTSATDTDFFATLCDVYPDGRAFNLCEGRLRTRFRHGFSKEILMTPNQVEKIELDLWSTSVVFNRGHKIRLQITSSSSPGFDPNPNNGRPFRSKDLAITATNRIHLAPNMASHLLLPITGHHPR